MNRTLRSTTLIIVLLMIAGMIFFLESLKPDVPKLKPGQGDIKIATEDTNDRTRAKAKLYPVAKELVSPAGFINTDSITVQELIGQKVIMIDFWTYSCINCQRTTPYLNAWNEKYKDDGLAIIGVHTPEFEFEKKMSNVEAAVRKLKIEYPVVLDSGYYTWNAYDNHYWPEKYLIDIDGFIVYRHIGEGGYKETEMKIKELLLERSKVLGKKGSTSEKDRDLVDPAVADVDFGAINSPETYFGWARNSNLGNGVPGREGRQTMKISGKPARNKLYMNGTWNIFEEYAENESPGAFIEFKYNAKAVYIVAFSEQPNKIRIMLDDKALGSSKGSDVRTDESGDFAKIQTSTLYRLVESETAGEHVIKMIIEDPGLQIYTFTFG